MEHRVCISDCRWIARPMGSYPRSRWRFGQHSRYLRRRRLLHTGTECALVWGNETARYRFHRGKHHEQCRGLNEDYAQDETRRCLAVYYALRRLCVYRSGRDHSVLLQVLGLYCAPPNAVKRVKMFVVNSTSSNLLWSASSATLPNSAA